MKILSLLIFVILLCPILVEKSYGQTTEVISNFTVTTVKDTGTQKVQNNTEVFVQIKLYDSSGRFVGYTEGHPQTIFHLDNIIKVVTSYTHTSTITKGEKTFEMWHFEDKINWPKVTAMGGYEFSVKQKSYIFGALVYNFDSFPISPGDTTRIFLTIIRLTS